MNILCIKLLKETINNIILIASFFLFSILPQVSHAEDLLQVFQLAGLNDPIIQAAKQEQLAAMEAFPQARSHFLPVITTNYIDYRHHKKYFGNQISISNVTIPLVTTKFNFRQGVYTLALTQPIFYYQQWVELDKAMALVSQANAIYANAEQDLILRTIQRYFQVLKASDNLKYASSLYDAYNELYSQINKRFEAGINTTTDVQLAKARRDSSYASVVAAENNLKAQKKALQELTCMPIEKFTPMSEQVKLLSPVPKSVNNWMETALAHNLTLQAVRCHLASLKEDVRINRSQHLPVVNLNSAFVHTGTLNDLFFTPKNNDSYIGLQVSMPIFTGGYITSKTRQAQFLYNQVDRQLEALYRQVETATYDSYLGVINQLAQIEAYKQAIRSNKTALEGVKESFDAEILYTIVDVLNSESDLIQAQQNYANARYDYILQSVLLKKNAGTLCPDDILLINDLLTK